MALKGGSELSVRIHGLRELSQKFRALDRALPRRVIAPAAKKAAEVVAVEARKRSPKRTGRLERSIKASATGTTGRVRAGTNTRVVYAPIQEFGWEKRNIKAQPYLYPALAEKRGEAAELFERELNATINWLIGGTGGF